MKVLIDTGFIYGYCDAKDAYHDRAVNIYNEIKYFNLYIAWPVTYETLRTKFVKRNSSVELFNKFFRDMEIEYIDDSIYRQAVLNETIKSVISKRPISMVDMLLRFILDRLPGIDALVTFNVADFQDVCRRKSIKIIN
jgi:predicted nucleic acid-binding protein